jgi:hypothetical protein
LEPLGLSQGWRALGLVARRWAGVGDPAPLAAWVREILARAPRPLADAVQDVSVDGQDVVVRFRPPEPLTPRLVEERTVECLLY